MDEDLKAAMTLLQGVFAGARRSCAGSTVGQLADTVAAAQEVANAAAAVQTLALAHLGARIAARSVRVARLGRSARTGSARWWTGGWGSSMSSPGPWSGRCWCCPPARPTPG